MPELTKETTAPENTRIFAQFPKEEFEEPLVKLKDLYGYESVALAARNCVRVAINLHDHNPDEFLTLLKN